MSALTTIYMVRHGQTEWNLAQRLQGHQDSPLTEEGLHQAHHVGESLAHIKFGSIYSSDIGRAKTTAEIIAQFHNQEVKTSDLIRERYFGKFQGKLATEVDAILKDKIAYAKSLPKQERLSYQIDPDIETDQEIMNRVYRFFQIIHDRHPGETILTVCHGALMRVFLIYLDFLRYDQFDRTAIDNLGQLIIQTDGTNVQLLKVNGVHLISEIAHV